MIIEVQSTAQSYMLQVAAATWSMLYELGAMSGVFFLPLIGVLWPAVRDLGTAWVLSLKTFLTVFSITMAMMLCIQPKVTPVIQVAAAADVCLQTDTAGAAEVFQVIPFESGELPVYWVLVLSLSSALTQAAIDQLSCDGDTRSMLFNSLYQSSIPDGQGPYTSPDGNYDLRSQLNRFHAECYQPAYNRWLQEQPSEASPYLEKWGEGDIDWVGSRTLQPYYETLHAQSVVPGHAYDPSRDEGYVDPTSEWGRPNCAEWWMDPQEGLYNVILLKDMDITRLAEVEERVLAMANPGVSEDQVIDMTYDIIVQEYIAENRAPVVSEVLGQGGSESGIAGYVTSALGAIGLGWSYISKNPMLHVTRLAGPLLQGVLIGLVVMLLLIPLLMNNYSWSLTFLASCVLFILVFYSFMFQVTGVIEEKFAEALFPNGPEMLGTVASAAIVDPDYASRAWILNLIIGTMHVMAIALTYFMLRWGGRQAVGIGEMLGSKSQEMGKMGEKGAEMAKQGAEQAVNRLTR